MNRRSGHDRRRPVEGVIQKLKTWYRDGVASGSKLQRYAEEILTDDRRKKPRDS